MKKHPLFLMAIVACLHDNDNDALVPEVWAQEALMQLEANLVMGNLVHRDFEPLVAEQGDTVNAHRPGAFKMKRKTPNGAVATQDARTENVAVTLNQQGHVSFLIGDVERTLALKDLFTLHLTPAVHAIAQGVEQVLLAQKYAFINNVVGKLGSALSKTEIIAVQTKANSLLWPMADRYGILTVNQDGSAKNIEDFTQAQKIGDDGTAVREGSLGRLFGTNWMVSQNNQPVLAGGETVVGAVNNVGGYAAGSTTLVVDGFTGTLKVGSWLTIAGDMTPQRITAQTVTGSGTDTTGITIAPGLRTAVANDAVITVVKPALVNNVAGYAAANKPMDFVIDGITVAPKSGQLVSFASTTAKYGAFDEGTLSTTALTLDRPLEVDVVNDDVVGLGPAGEYGLVFNRNAIALVTRPLALPPTNSGVQSAVANYNGLSIRVTMGYDMDYQKTRVTVDILYGVKVLDERLGMLLLS